MHPAPNRNKAVESIFLSEPEGFWWLIGYIFGDGNIYFYKDRHSVRISLHAYEDVKQVVLDNFGPWGCSEFKKAPGQFQMYFESLAVGHYFKHHFGIAGPKSDILRFPKHLLEPQNERFAWQFVRGFFDADGCVSTQYESEAGLASFQVSLSSNSHEFLTEIGQFIGTHGIESRLGFKQKCGVLTIGKKESVSAMVERLYSDGTSIYSSRRYEKCQQAFQSVVVRTSVCSRCGKSERFTANLCYRCFYDDRLSPCSCGKKAVALGLCSTMYCAYQRTKVLPFFSRENDGKNLVNHLLDSDRDLHKRLRSCIPSFYAAHHNGFSSIASLIEKPTLSLDNPTVFVNESRRLMTVKPASWFTLRAANNLLEMAAQEIGDFETVFDPFHGWGTRALASLRLGKKYTGYDLNPYLCHEMRAHLRSPLYEIHEADSFSSPIPRSDVVMTCPPYWDAENYEYKHKSFGYEDFLRKLVRLINACIQKSRIALFAIDDFSFGGRKYTFVSDVQKILQSLGIESESRTFFHTKRSFNAHGIDNQVLIVRSGVEFLPDEIRLVGVTKQPKTSERVYRKKPKTQCSFCENTSIVLNPVPLCRNHYNNKVGQEIREKARERLESMKAQEGEFSCQSKTDSKPSS
jgi:intein-encoded DNA endonuclease-like protein